MLYRLSQAFPGNDVERVISDHSSIQSAMGRAYFDLVTDALNDEDVDDDEFSVPSVWTRKEGVHMLTIENHCTYYVRKV